MTADRMIRRSTGFRLTALYSFSREEERQLDDQGEALNTVARRQAGGVEYYADWQGKQQLGRTAYCTMLAHLRERKLNWLVVYRLDKLGLGLGGLAELFGELARHEAGFTSLSEDLCFEPEELAALPALLNAAAFMQRRLLGDKTADGCAKAKKRGKAWGGSRPGRSISVTQEQRAQVLALLAIGKPKAFIARVTGLSRDTVYRLSGPRRRSKPL